MAAPTRSSGISSRGRCLTCRAEFARHTKRIFQGDKMNHLQTHLPPGASRRKALAMLTAGALWPLAMPLPAMAQQAPMPTLVKLVVGYTPGGPVDGAARLLAPALAQELGTQVI